MCRRQCRHLLAPAGCRRVCFIVNLYVCRRRHLAGVFPPSKSLRVPAPAPAPVPAPCRRVPPSKSLHVPAPTPAPVPALAGVGTLPACLLLVVPAALVACVLAYMRKFPAVRPTEKKITLYVYHYLFPLRVLRLSCNLNEIVSFNIYFGFSSKKSSQNWLRFWSWISVVVVGR